MNKQEILDSAKSLHQSLRATVANVETNFGRLVDEFHELVEIGHSANELWTAAADVFRRVRSEVVGQLGPVDDFAALEHLAVTHLRSLLDDPATMTAWAKAIAAKLHDLAVVIEPEPVTVPDAAPAPGAPVPDWEYVFDANGIATGTRPLAAPSAPVAAPEAPAAPVDAAPAVPSAETAT